MLFRASELLGLFAGLERYDPIIVAVSGGSDSVALMHLLHCWRKVGGYHGRVIIASVDHRLRKQATSEADLVKQQAQELGFSHELLSWRGIKPKSNLQEQARIARYRLLIGLAYGYDCGCILTGHQLGDQAETMLLRIARGSGVYGLGGMSREMAILGVKLIRPLLEVPKQKLKEFLLERGVAWCDDPSNDDETFQRVKIRRLLPDLAAYGLTPLRLSATARRLRAAANVLESVLVKFIADSAIISPFGFIVVAKEKFLETPRETVLRALRLWLFQVGGQRSQARMVNVERLYRQLRLKTFNSATLNGCKVDLCKDKIIITREVGRTQPKPIIINPGTCRLWDRRFLIKVSAHSGSPVVIKAIGDNFRGDRVIKAAVKIIKDKYNLPRMAIAGLPVVWQNNNVAGVPCLDGLFDRDTVPIYGDNRGVVAHFMVWKGTFETQLLKEQIELLEYFAKYRENCQEFSYGAVERLTFGVAP